MTALTDSGRFEPGGAGPAAAAAVHEQRLIGIVRTATAASAREAVDRLLRSGVRVVEVSLTVPDALTVIAEAADSAPAGFHVGVGTARTPSDVRAAHGAGAEFVVSPTWEVDVVAETLRLGMASVPGVLTPTEAVAAHRAGAHLVKLFPASQWTPASLRDLRAPLPDLPFVPTGGISLAAAAEWIKVGAVAVGLGSALTAGAADEAGSRIARLLGDLRAAR